jgi:hypothetical protein
MVRLEHWYLRWFGRRLRQLPQHGLCAVDELVHLPEYDQGPGLVSFRIHQEW